MLYITHGKCLYETFDKRVKDNISIKKNFSLQQFYVIRNVEQISRKYFNKIIEIVIINIYRDQVHNNSQIGLIVVDSNTWR